MGVKLKRRVVGYMLLTTQIAGAKQHQRWKFCQRSYYASRCRLTGHPGIVPWADAHDLEKTSKVWADGTPRHQAF
jgi:hypothetical protein